MNGEKEAGPSSSWGAFPAEGHFPPDMQGNDGMTGRWDALVSHARHPSLFALMDEPWLFPGAIGIEPLSAALGYRLLGQSPLSDAGERLNRIVDVDVVLLRCTGREAGLDLLLTRLDAMASLQGARFVVVTSLAGLDRVHALVSAPQAVILCEPDHIDVITTLAAVSGLSVERNHLHDIGREAGDQRLDRLSEELVRLNRMIETLVEGRSAGHISALAWGGDKEGNPGMGEGSRHASDGDSHLAVHTPGRDFKTFPSEMSPSSVLKITASQVRAVLRIRRLREQIFPPDMFADPAWDILLDLMAARLEKTRVSVSSLCIAAAVPPTTALRWIRHLTDNGLLERQADPDDGRRIFITLSEKGAASVLRWFQESANHVALVAGSMSGNKGNPGRT